VVPDLQSKGLGAFQGGVVATIPHTSSACHQTRSTRRRPGKGQSIVRAHCIVLDSSVGRQRSREWCTSGGREQTGENDVSHDDVKGSPIPLLPQ
jgi:hypothetical protein